MVDFNEEGFETYTISSTGNYEITAIGATGGGVLGSDGTSLTNVGGEGVEVTGTFALSANDVIEILVGQAGGNSSVAGGGGGGTFVFDETTGTLLEVAGGGGGASSFAGGNGGNAETGTAGGPQSGSSVLGGVNGEGGGAEDRTDYAGAGAGVLGSGQPNTLDADYTGKNTAGIAPVFPGTGGDGGTGYAGGVTGSGDGGFGGGGGAGETTGGGGGGFSGGAAGVAALEQTAGGGGSYIDASAKNADVFDVNTSGDGTAGLPGFTPGATHDGYVEISCFTAGTMIATPHGEVPVETLQAGQFVLTASSAAKPIKWIGCTVAPAKHAPICIAAGALAENMPHRDLYVSPDHAMFLEGVFVPAKLLLNGITITQSARSGAIEYYHIEIEPHDIIIAEGALTESFLDIGDRARFMQRGVISLFLTEELKTWEDAAAPLVLSGPHLAAIRLALLQQAMTTGSVQSTQFA